MARPMLQNLTPGTTSFASGLNATTAPAVTVGNPYLSPFRSTNLDFSLERYFGRSGLIGIAFFYKDLKSFPQQLAGEAPLDTVFEPEIYEQVVAAMVSPTLQAYTSRAESMRSASSRTLRAAPSRASRSTSSPTSNSWAIFSGTSELRPTTPTSIPS